MDQHTPDDCAGCPSRETLAEFNQGLLPEAELEAVAGHLAGCARCEAALRELGRGPGDEMTARLRRWVQWPSVLHEPGWARLKAAAEAIIDQGGTPTTDPEPTRAQ
jgi:hypothetical protein